MEREMGEEGEHENNIKAICSLHSDLRYNFSDLIQLCVNLPLQSMLTFIVLLMSAGPKAHALEKINQYPP